MGNLGSSFYDLDSDGDATSVAATARNTRYNGSRVNLAMAEYGGPHTNRHPHNHMVFR